MLFWELRWAIIGLVVVVFSGTVTYHFLEDWSWIDSLWMVVITLTTIGFGEPEKLSDAGRVFTMILIVSGVGIVAYTVSKVAQYIMGGGLIFDLKERIRRRKMKQIEDHIIVVGMGRLGREVVQDLLHSNCSVVGIDENEEKLKAAPGLTVQIQGDGSQDEILKQAGIERAKGLAIATRSSATNVYVTLSARQLNPSLHILTRVDEEGAGEKAIRAGADEVINPFGISGARMAQGLIRPHAANFVDLAIGRSFGDFALEDVTLGNAVQFHGSLEEIDIPNKHSVMVIGIRKSSGHLVTSIDRHTVLSQGDVVVVIGRPADIGNFALAAGGTSNASTKPRRKFEP